MKPVTRIKGPCSLYTGYGKLFTGIAAGLIKKRPVELLALNNDVPDPSYPLKMSTTSSAEGVGMIFGYAPHIRQLSTRYQILYTMYEASDIPSSWPSDVALADEVWVPSDFCYHAFARHSKREPVIVWPGVDNTVFCHDPKFENDRDWFWYEALGTYEMSGKFIVGTAGVMSLRKGIDVLVEAFHAAFEGDPGVVLVVKTRDTKMSSRQVEVAKSIPGVVFLDLDWPENMMAKFYRSIDLFVLPTRGEGLCLPPLEAAMCGTPALVTRFSGPMEYIDDRGIFGIEVDDVMRAKGIAATGGYWAEPSVSDLVDKLRSFRDNVPRVARRYMSWALPEAVMRFDVGLDHAWKRARHGSANSIRSRAGVNRIR